MPLRFWLHLAEIAVLFLLASALFISWREGRLDHDQLTVALADAKQALSTADARQHDRDAQLTQTLASLAALKTQPQTTAQLTKNIASQMTLPMPLNIESSELSNSSGMPSSPVAGSKTGAVAPDAPQAKIVVPSQDLQPLYDFALDCKACQAKLATAQGDLSDERAKTAALGKERDAALKAARGGSLWRRMTRAAKWFALGAAAGALAAKSAH
jgi:hypothetical protein